MSPTGRLYLGTVGGQGGAVVRVHADGAVEAVARGLGEPRYLAADEGSLFIGDPPQDTIWRVDVP